MSITVIVRYNSEGSDFIIIRQWIHFRLMIFLLFFCFFNLFMFSNLLRWLLLHLAKKAKQLYNSDQNYRIVAVAMGMTFFVKTSRRTFSIETCLLNPTLIPIPINLLIKRDGQGLWGEFFSSSSLVKMGNNNSFVLLRL